MWNSLYDLGYMTINQEIVSNTLKIAPDTTNVSPTQRYKSVPTPSISVELTQRNPLAKYCVKPILYHTL